MSAIWFSMAWKSALLLAGGVTVSALSAPAGALARRTLGRLVLAGVLALPLAIAALPALPLPLGRPAPTARMNPTAPDPWFAAAEPTLATSTAAAGPTAQAPARPARNWAGWLIALWLLGSLAMAARLVADVMALHRLVRRAQSADDTELSPLAERLGLRRRIRLCQSSEVDVPQAGGVRRPVVFLPAAASSWPCSRRRVVLLHELSHIRSGDCGWQLAARLAAAIYWWNPLAWRVARQLRLASEQCCDAAALAAARMDGIEAPDYAAHLVAIARTLLPGSRPLPLAAAMASTTQIEQRVRAILEGSARTPRTSRMAMATVLFCAGATALAAVRPVQAPGPSLTFEAATVKPYKAPGGGVGHSHSNADPVHLVMIGTLHRLLIQAYTIGDHQLVNEPGWFNSELYSVEAVTAAPAQPDQMMAMLRNLLGQRFQLALRQEKRTASGYALAVAPGGVKFRALRPGEQPTDPDEPAGTFARSFSSISELVDSLNQVYGGRLYLDRPVVDDTHLTGRYWMVLQTEMDRQPGAPEGRRLTFPNLAHDLEAQLGLRLVPAKVPLPYYVVEHAARPAGN